MTCYSCSSCNSANGDLKIPDPSKFPLANAVRVHEDSSLEPQTLEAERIVHLLGLNEADDRKFRRLWIGVVRLAAQVDVNLFLQLMGFPVDLPILSRLWPPTNSRPEGVKTSWFAKRVWGELPETY